MHKLLLVMTCLIISINSFANITKTVKNDEILSENLQTEKNHDSFEEKSKASIKKLLKKKNYSLISNSILRNYYKESNYTLFWINENGIKQIALDLLDKVKNDPVLKPHSKKAFHLDKVINTLNNLDKTPENYLESMTKIDFILTGIYSKYMTYLSKGFINWDSFKEQLKELDEKNDINAGWEKYNVRKSFKQLLLKAVEHNNINVALNEVNYTFPKANELANKIEEFEKLALNGGYIKIPKSKTLKIGIKDPVIKTLRERLTQSNHLVQNNCEQEIKAENLITNTTSTKNDKLNENIQIITDGSNTIENNCYEIYDEKVKEAVISFQKSHGLNPDGIVGSTTRKYLNIPVERKIVQMRLNLERMRWLPRDLGEKFLLVNIPEYKLRMYEGDKVKLKMRTVVGETKHPTPIFSNKVSFVVLNPYWKIPHSIVRKEIVPKLVSNPNYLNEKGIKIHENWDYKSTTVDGSTIDWNYYLDGLNRIELLNKIKDSDEEEKIVEEEIEKNKVPIYRFIQIPSETNPLGRMKFMFPNKYSVYLHDSPAKKYFEYNRRAYSHGCVRLAEPKKLLEAIASMDENLNFTEATEVLKDIDKTQINLNKQIPVHLVYLTSWIDEEGNIQFRDDIYKYDTMQGKLLYNPKQFM